MFSSSSKRVDSFNTRRERDGVRHTFYINQCMFSSSSINVLTVWSPSYILYKSVYVFFFFYQRVDSFSDQEGERWSPSYILYKSVYVFFFFYQRVDSFSDWR